MKIKNLKTSKTNEIIEREWLQVEAKKNQLLSSSEWTQSLDNDLTMESQIYWTHWRFLIRSVNRNTFNNPEDAQKELESIFSKQPAKEYVFEPRMKQRKYVIDISSVDNAKSDAIKAIKQFVDNSINNSLPESSTTIMLKYIQTKDMLTDAKIQYYPLLNLHKKQFNLTETSEVIDSVHNLYKVLTETTEFWIEKQFEYENQINECISIKQIIQVLKKMHGY